VADWSASLSAAGWWVYPLAAELSASLSAAGWLECPAAGWLAYRSALAARPWPSAEAQLVLAAAVEPSG
jgi:hypothetical protein